MRNRWSADQIEEGVRGCVAEALALDQNQITRTATILGDLDAESIDLLDIRFRLEHAFNLKIRQEEIIKSVGAGADPQEIRKQLTVGSLVSFIFERLQSESRA